MMEYQADHFAFNVSNGIYQLIEDDYSIQHDGQEIVGIYNYIDDPSMSNNLKDEEFLEKEYLIKKSFAVYQQISNRILDNQLVLK